MTSTRMAAQAKWSLERKAKLDAEQAAGRRALFRASIRDLDEYLWNNTLNLRIVLSDDGLWLTVGDEGQTFPAYIDEYLRLGHVRLAPELIATIQLSAQIRPGASMLFLVDWV